VPKTIKTTYIKLLNCHSPRTIWIFDTTNQLSSGPFPEADPTCIPEPLRASLELCPCSWETYGDGAGDRKKLTAGYGWMSDK